MRRFVVLSHDFPVLHWDLMLEQGNALRTWRLSRLPDSHGPIEAEPLAEHRLAYLDYEGPVSGGRGQVHRWDFGEYQTIESTSERLVVRFTGRRLDGEATLEQSPTAARWVFRMG